ncbi:MAG: PEP-CTERM sorting domain-containing protein [Gammaproteobacteria bacterium]|jgi:hypothetical protein
MSMISKTVTAIAFASAASFANANLLTNGDFEANVGLSGTSWGVYQSIDGWNKFDGPGIEIQRNTVIAAQSGNQYVELDSHYNSSMYQEISGLTVGGAYELSFWYHARTNNGYNDNGINVYWGDYLPGDVAVSIDGMKQVNTPGWIEQTVKLVASAETMFLMFAATGYSNSLGGFVDNVSLTAVPEPGTLALFGLGLMGLVLARRQQKAA